MNDIMISLKELFEKNFDRKVINILQLPVSGSDRTYFRIYDAEGSFIGAYSPDIKENKAFWGFTGHFLSKNLPVPRVLAKSPDCTCYIIEDLGDTTLFSHICNLKKQDAVFPPHLVDLYRRILDYLLRFQFEGNQGLDYSLCHQRSVFDAVAMHCDLNYFKYYFLKLAEIPFDEERLDESFNSLTEFLSESAPNYFMYRDFQSRNIMLMNGEPYFIDYQSGRKGPLQYDPASLLFDGKVNMPNDIKTALLNYYINQLGNYTSIYQPDFEKQFYGFALLRIMQAMGAYGYRGFFQGKKHFLQSIPYAFKNIESLLSIGHFDDRLSYLIHLVQELPSSEKLNQIVLNSVKLTVSISSFSYKRGIPYDKSGHGGGYVFDCRAIHNPGKYETYKQLTGNDSKVIEFLDKEADMQEFLSYVFSMLNISVKNYLTKGFTNLSVHFGCTGGQHRSVYAANRTLEFLREKFDVNTELKHCELQTKKLS